MSAVVKHPARYRAYRISPDDSNRLVLIFDPQAEQAPFVACVEIFDAGGATPPNTHLKAHEMFFVLKGQARARAGGVVAELEAGDSLLVPPGDEHVIENTGAGRLYTLTVMVPDEDFATLIRSGTEVALDAEDLAVLRGFPTLV